MTKGRKETGLGRSSTGAGRGVRRVRKRDGRVVPFQREKIAAAVRAALEAAGEPDPGFAKEVASVVELTLEDRTNRRRRSGDSAAPPEIEEIQDLVERALMELGRAAVAKTYILYRDQRSRIRDAMRVHRSDAMNAPVRVREKEGVSAWSKGRVVAGLISEAELPREAAEEVASAVERRVFASGLRRVTTGLIRELVAGELFERGLLRARSFLGAIGLSRADLVRLLRGEPMFTWEDDPGGETELRARDLPALQRLGGELLRRHALETLVPEGIGELHRAGDLHVEGLASLHQPLSICVDTELLASGGKAASSAFAVLEGVAELSRRVSRLLVLERPGRVLAPLVRSARKGSALGLSGWLRSLEAVARAARVRIDLGSSGTKFQAWNARLLEELVLLPAGPHAPRLYLEGHELEALLAHHQELAPSVEHLLREGRLLSSFGDEEEAFAGPGCHRMRREPGILACGAAIAINLPRLARRAGAFREELVQRGISELVRAALELFAELSSFQEAHEPARSFGLHMRRSFAIVPVGLREALLLLGDGEIDPQQGAQLLGLVNDAASRLGGGGASPVAPCGFFGERAARRFAWLDGERSREAGLEQRWLFAEAGSEAPPALPPGYTPDFRLSPVAAFRSGRFEAEVLKTLRAGALAFDELCAPREALEPEPHLAAWRRFEVLRREKRGELSLELFPPAPSSGSNRHAPPPLRPLV